MSTAHTVWAASTWYNACLNLRIHAGMCAESGGSCKLYKLLVCRISTPWPAVEIDSKRIQAIRKPTEHAEKASCFRTNFLLDGKLKEYPQPQNLRILQIAHQKLPATPPRGKKLNSGQHQGLCVACAALLERGAFSFRRSIS